MGSIENFQLWFNRNGGYFHPDVHYVSVPDSGYAIKAKSRIPADSKVVSCPFELVVSKESATSTLIQLLNLQPAVFEHWNARQCISSYLFLHSVGQSSPLLKHQAYIHTLPTPEKLITAMYFSDHEREMFKGTNLYPAILDRQTQWTTEWKQCRDAISQANADWGRAYSWDSFLAYATYVSSRAFPSSLLSSTPTLIPGPSTEPVLIPGLDALNHRRAQPVSWVYSPDPQPAMSIVICAPTEAGEELFNNYGPKPNVELILGYGFSFPQNPDDTILLQIGGQPANKKWDIGRDAAGMEPLWDELVGLVAENPSSPSTYEDLLEASAVLTEMTERMIDRLPVEIASSGIRDPVRLMWEHYIEGQRAILTSVVAFADQKKEVAIEIAREQGIDLVFEDEE